MEGADFALVPLQCPWLADQGCGPRDFVPTFAESAINSPDGVRLSPQDKPSVAALPGTRETTPSCLAQVFRTQDRD